MAIFVEWNELNNISSLILLEFLWKQRCFVSIELIHTFKICITHSNNYNGKRQVRSWYNFINWLLQIIDHAISEDEEDRVLLVILGHFSLLLLAVAVYVAQNFRKHCRTIKLNSIDWVLVSVKNTLNPLDLWIEYIAIKSKAMAHILTFVKPSPKPVNWIFLVRSIAFKDSSNRLYGHLILIWLVSLWVHIM